MFVTYQSASGVCGNANRIAEIGPDAVLTNERTFPDDVDFEKVAVSPDGRILAFDRVGSATGVYEVDVNSLAVTSLGSHLVSLPDLSVPARRATWGEIKSDYR